MEIIMQNTAVQLPDVLVDVILDYEGAQMRAWQLDYIKGIYIIAYKRYFGRSCTFKQICKCGGYLPVYMYLAKVEYCRNFNVKVKKSVLHMKPWKKHFPNNCGNLKKRCVPTYPIGAIIRDLYINF